MRESAIKNSINVYIDSYDKNTHSYDIQRKWYAETNETNTMFFYIQMVCHIMNVIDDEKLTNIFICPNVSHMSLDMRIDIEMNI